MQLQTNYIEKPVLHTLLILDIVTMKNILLCEGYLFKEYYSTNKL